MVEFEDHLFARILWRDNKPTSCLDFFEVSRERMII